MTPVLARLLTPALLVLLLLFAPSPTATGAGEPEPVGGWPLLPRPEVVAGFDPPADAWGAGHRGVDLLGSHDQAVRAALPGTVAFAGRLAGRGVVVVEHGDTRTTYEPVLSTRAVGDPVAAGDVIGRLETLGSHCFPRSCLHWGWLRGEVYLDPLLLVGAGPVRLLPLWRDRPVSAVPGVAGAVRRAVESPWAGWRAPLELWRLRPAGVPAGRPVAGGPW